MEERLMKVYRLMNQTYLLLEYLLQKGEFCHQKKVNHFGSAFAMPASCRMRTDKRE